MQQSRKNSESDFLDDEAVALIAANSAWSSTGQLQPLPDLSQSLDCGESSSSSFHYQLGPGEQHDALTWEPRGLPKVEENEQQTNEWPDAEDISRPVKPLLIDYSDNMDHGLDINPADFEPVFTDLSCMPELVIDRMQLDPAERREMLLSRVLLLKRQLSTNDCILIAVYVLGSCTLGQASAWLTENEFHDIMDFDNRRAGTMASDRKLDEKYRLYTEQRNGKTLTVQLTVVGTASAETLLGYDMTEYSLEFIQRLPLSSRLRYALACNGAMSASEYSRWMVDHGLNLTHEGKSMTARHLIGACSTTKASQGGSGGNLVSLNNYMMTRTNAVEQWGRRTITPVNRNLGMEVMTPAFWHYANNDLSNPLFFHAIRSSCITNFFTAIGDRFRVAVDMPAGVLIDESTLIGCSSAPAGANSVTFSLVSFDFIPGLEGALFFMAKTAPQPGQWIRLDRTVTLHPRPAQNERKMSAADVKRISSAAIRKEKQRRNAVIQAQVESGCEPSVRLTRTGVPKKRQRRRDSSPVRGKPNKRHPLISHNELVDLVGPIPVLI